MSEAGRACELCRQLRVVQVHPTQLHASLSHLPEDSEYLCYLEGVRRVLLPSLKIPPAKPMGSCYPLLLALLRVRFTKSGHQKRCFSSSSGSPKPDNYIHSHGVVPSKGSWMGQLDPWESVAGDLSHEPGPSLLAPWPAVRSLWTPLLLPEKWVLSSVPHVSIVFQIRDCHAGQ